MFEVTLLFLTVNPDFYLPFHEFDKKYCARPVAVLYSLPADRAMGYERGQLRWTRNTQLARMLKGLSPIPNHPANNVVQPASSQFAPPFSVVMMFLTVHPDFYLPNDKFDLEYCRPEYGRLLSAWNSYRSWGESYDEALSDQERERIAQSIDRVCSEIVRLTAEVNEFRYYQRSRFLRGIPLHTYPKP